MLSRNQQIIKEYFNNIYKDLLVKPCILTSIIIPEKPTKDVVNIIGTFNPEVKIKNITSMPVISINYIDEETLVETENELREIYLKEIKNVINKLITNSSIFYSLSLDYRLINESVIKILKKKYEENKFTLRIIGEDYTLTSDTYEKLSFIDEIIVSKASDTIVSLKGSDLIINNNLVIDNIIPNKGYDPINEFYITKDLTPEEYALVTDKINNTISLTKKLFIRVYNPENYEYIIDNIIKNNLEESVELNFLSNPLEDKAKHFEALRKCPHRVTITYSTDAERITRLTKEPYSDCAHYIEELECNGKSEILDYLNILYSVNFIERKANHLELSPLEKLVYVYRYIEKNAQPFKKNKFNTERTYKNKYSFAKLFSILMRKIEIACFVYTTNTRLKNISRIFDRKYKIDRILITDITADTETKRFEQYKIYSFSNFGFSPIDTLKTKEIDYITIPAALVLSQNSYYDNIETSYNELIRSNNLTKSTFDFTLKFLNLSGYTNITEQTNRDDYYIFTADLLANGTMESLESTILKTAVTKIVDKEINDSRVEQKEFEIKNTVSSNEIGRNNLAEHPRILLNKCDSKNKIVPISLVEAKDSNAELNNQKALFTNKVDQIINNMMSTKKDLVTELKSNELLINTSICILEELYKDNTEFSLLTSSNKKRIMKTIYSKYEKKLYKEIPETLYKYLTEDIIPELEYILASKEYKYLIECSKDKYDSKEYSKYDFRFSTKLKYFIDKLNNEQSKDLGITYKCDDIYLIINISNDNFKEYKVKLISDEIEELINSKEEQILTISSKTYDNRKVNDYIEVYLEKIEKYNDHIEEANELIENIESLDIDITKINTINKFIDLEKKLIKIEEQLFKFKIELSNFRNTFYTRFNTNITTYQTVKKSNLNTYIYNRKFDTCIEIFNIVEEEIIRLAEENPQMIKNNEEINLLLVFLDYLNSYINRRVISENQTIENISNRINDLYHKKNLILKKLEEIENVSNGSNIIVKNDKLELLDDLVMKIAKVNRIIKLENIVFYKLTKSLKVRLSNQILNRFKNPKNKLHNKVDKII